MIEQRTVTPALANQALDALVRSLFEVSWSKARSWIETGKVSVNGKVVLELRFAVAAGATIVLNMNAPRVRAGAGPGVAGSSGSASGADPGQERPNSLPAPRELLVHMDSQVIVLNKPPGISTVPYAEGETGTLLDIARSLAGRGRVEVVHRIDKETSGLVVFARTTDAARELGNQFRFHRVHRRYLAIAHERVKSGTLHSVLIENRGDGLRGSVPPGWRVAPREGKEATTHVSAREVLAAGRATLVECRLETGRTHQIRIHLSEAGHPLLGEKLYVRDLPHKGAEMLPAPRVMLHAAELGFRHPSKSMAKSLASGASDGEEMRWSCELPADFRAVLDELRGKN